MLNKKSVYMIIRNFYFISVTKLKNPIRTMLFILLYVQIKILRQNFQGKPQHQ